MPEAIYRIMDGAPPPSRTARPLRLSGGTMIVAIAVVSWIYSLWKNLAPMKPRNQLPDVDRRYDIRAEVRKEKRS